jgi:oligoribonuclease
MATLSYHRFILRTANIDVSTIKELSQMWSPELKAASPFKNYGHRALDDVKESIMELRYYKDTLWNDVK